MPRGNKITKAIYDQRIASLLPLISFMSRSEILQYVAKKENWNVGHRQIDIYIKGARELLKNDLAEYKENATENAYNNYIMLFKKALKKEDHKLCLQIQDSIAKLFGLNQINLDLTTKGDKINSFTVKIESE